MAEIDIDGGVSATTLNGSITSGSSTINLTDGSTYPPGTTNFYIVIDRGTASEEVIEISARSTHALTVATRGADGTSATSHDDGATVEHCVPASAIQEANTHANQTTGTPHGSAYIQNTAGAVSTSNLDDDAVDGSKIADDAVDSEHITSGAVDNDHLAATGHDISKFTTGTSDRNTTGSAAYLTDDSNVKPQQAVTSDSVPVSVTTEQDIGGCSITLTTPRTNMTYVVTGVFDFRVTGDGTVTATSISGKLNVDGSNEDATAVLAAELEDVDNVRTTVTQTWVVTLATAASHTLKLRAVRATGSSTCEYLDHTYITVVHAYG